jgi:hypothetical protein
MLITIDNYIKILEPISPNMPPKVYEIYTLFKDTIPDYLAFPILIEENKEEINNHLNIMNRYYESTIPIFHNKFTIQTPSQLDIEKHFDSPIHFKQTESEVTHHPINLPEPKNLEGIFNMNSKTELKSERSFPESIKEIVQRDSLTTLIKPIESVNNDQLTFSDLDKDIINLRKNISGLSVRKIIKKNNCRYWDYSKALNRLIQSGIVSKKTDYDIKYGRPKKV